MLRKFQEGISARPNALAALANTGRPHPGARRPLAGAVQQVHRPELATRPGPQPLSARQAVAVHQRNAQTERAMRQMLHLLTVPYASYKPGAPGRDPWQNTQDEFGQIWAVTEVDHVWVYSHEINQKGD